jgi:hypothetical protein
VLGYSAPPALTGFSKSFRPSSEARSRHDLHAVIVLFVQKDAVCSESTSWCAFCGSRF